MVPCKHCGSLLESECEASSDIRASTRRARNDEDEPVSSRSGCVSTLHPPSHHTFRFGGYSKRAAYCYPTDTTFIMERRGSTQPSTLSSSSHRHSKSLGTLNGLNGLNLNGGGLGLDRQQTGGGLAGGGGMGSVPMSPAASRGKSALSPSMLSAPMSPAGSLGFGREGEWSDIQAR